MDRRPRKLPRNLIAGVALLCAACGSRGGPLPPPTTAHSSVLSFPRASELIPQETIEPYTPYLDRRASHQTRLVADGPEEERDWTKPPDGAEEVTYPSDDLILRGWLVVPEGETGSRRPGVVFLHNDFELTRTSYENARALADRGYVVFLPALRAENGNPGDFELLWGEVDDAENAVSWLASHPAVDPDFVYVIGHSIGGGIASLLNLRPDLRARRTASIGGTYRARTLHVWALQAETTHLVRFNPADADEVTLRLLVPNLRDMTRPHIAYAGREASRDLAYARYAKRLADDVGAPFELVEVTGAHMSSAVPAVEHFAAVIERDRRGQVTRLSRTEP
ncbi:MAG: dienelactone hydrolase family protein [Myxococcota bacterium]